MGLEKSLLDNLAKIRGNGVPNYENQWNINSEDGGSWQDFQNGLYNRSINNTYNSISGQPIGFNGTLPMLPNSPTKLSNQEINRIGNPIRGGESNFSGDVVKMITPSLSEVFGEPFNKKWVKETTKKAKLEAEGSDVNSTKPSFGNSINNNFVEGCSQVER